MKAKYLIPLSVAAYIFSYGLVAISPDNAAGLLERLILPALSIISGLLIGSVGVFLGSIGNLYTLLRLKESKLGLRELDPFFDLITKAVKEVKDNVLFTVISIAISLFLTVIKGSKIKWASGPWWANKDLIIGSLIAFMTIIAFYAIIDCIQAMFTLHQHYQAIIKASLSQEEKP